MEKSKTTSIEQFLAKEIEDREALDPGFYYQSKLPAIKRARASGMNDEIIESLFNLTLKPQDRS